LKYLLTEARQKKEEGQAYPYSDQVNTYKLQNTGKTKDAPTIKPSS